MSVLGGEDPSHAGISGVKSDNMSCVCDLRNCHCAHDDFNTDHEEYYSDTEFLENKNQV